MYWIDGAIYKGYWKEGHQCGYGILQDQKGNIKEGLFENGVFKVKGTEEEINNKTYLLNEEQLR